MNTDAKDAVQVAGCVKSTRRQQPLTRLGPYAYGNAPMQLVVGL
ncbi:hypothetical protein [Nocardioides sp. Soil777]|nr:hypothetical protein [Nocardioides sp. Soil777]